MPKVTPSSWACGTRRSIARAARSRAARRSRSPGGSPPGTSTSVAAWSAAASSSASRLLASAARASAGSAVVKNPPRHSDETRSPDSVTRRQPSSRPTSASCSRQTPIAPSPASTQPCTASGSDHEAVVRWLSESRRSAVLVPHRATPDVANRLPRRCAASSGSVSSRASLASSNTRARCTIERADCRPPTMTKPSW